MYTRIVNKHVEVIDDAGYSVEIRLEDVPKLIGALETIFESED